MKILNYFLLFILASTSVLAIDGNGTQSNPYMISDCQELQELDNNSLFYVSEPFYAEFDSDIDCNAINFNSIGSQYNTSGGAAVKIKLDAKNYTISNLMIDNTTGVGDLGLFEYLSCNIGEGCYVKNLNIDNVQVDAQSSFAGIITGIVDNYNFTNITVQNSLINSTSGIYLGLIASQGSANYNGITLEDSAIIGGSAYIGGITGGITGAKEFSRIVIINVSIDGSSNVGYISGSSTNQVVDNAIIATTYSNFATRPTGLQNLDPGLIFVDSNTTGNSHAYSKTTEEMQNRSTYNSSWDFNTTWYMINGNYPRLLAYTAAEINMTEPGNETEGNETETVTPSGGSGGANWPDDEIEVQDPVPVKQTWFDKLKAAWMFDWPIIKWG